MRSATACCGFTPARSGSTRLYRSRPRRFGNLLDLVRRNSPVADRVTLPRKDTCLAIYSYTVNAGCPLEETLAGSFHGVTSGPATPSPLSGVCRRKQQDNVLDTTTSCCTGVTRWPSLLSPPKSAGALITSRRQYQDTNRSRPRSCWRCVGRVRLTVVATTRSRSIRFARLSAQHSRLSRSVSPRPLSSHSNAIIDRPSRSSMLLTGYRRAGERFAKILYSTKESAELPTSSAPKTRRRRRAISPTMSSNTEGGIALKRQTVLFRAAHHSDLLEIELWRRNIRSLNMAAQISRSAMSRMCSRSCGGGEPAMRWRLRALQLHPASPATARNLIDRLSHEGFAAAALARFTPPAAAFVMWRVLPHDRAPARCRHRGPARSSWCASGIAAA